MAADDLDRVVRDLQGEVHMIATRQATVLVRLDRGERDDEALRREYQELRAHMDACTSRIEEKIAAMREDYVRRFAAHGRYVVGILVALIMNLLALVFGVLPRILTGLQPPP